MSGKTSFERRTVAEIADAFPQAIEVFEEAGIDYACKGLRSITDAATAAGYTPGELLELIEAEPIPAPAPRWSERPIEELTIFLCADHREVASVTIPAIWEAIVTAMQRQPANGGLRRLASLFSTFSAGVKVHMAHEERDLFATMAREKSVRPVAKTRLSQRVLREFVEHETFGEQLRTMREICLRLPPECRGDLAGELERFTRSVHLHMHLENNILYPRAIALENELQRAS